MGRAKYLPGPNPEWDRLLSEEEKEFVREWRWSVDLTRLPAEDVRRLVRAAKAFAEELSEEAPAAEGPEGGRR
jgi:hypothetical protein